jgi:hypothetical protein
VQASLMSRDQKLNFCTLKQILRQILSCAESSFPSTAATVAAAAAAASSAIVIFSTNTCSKLVLF